MARANIPHLDVQQTVQETLTSLGPGIAYSRLLRLRTGPQDEIPQPSLLLECDLCEGWEVTDLSPLTYRFQLRQGVRWQDVPPGSSREVTASDVVFSLDRQVRDPEAANAILLQNVQSVVEEDRYSLTIALKAGFPDADFLLALADGHSKVVLEEAVLLRGHLRDGPVVGSGPWIWDPKRSREDIASVFRRNPGYFEEGLPFLDELVISVIRDEEARYAAFITGTVDVIRVPPETWDRIRREGRQFPAAGSSQGGAGLVLTMNVSVPPFDDIDVRRAVFQALDPWEYVRTIWADQGYVSLGLPVESPGWLLTKEEARAASFGDPSRASDILDALGLPGPLKFQLTAADYGDIHLKQARALEADLRSVGFDPTFLKVNPPQYGDTVWRDKAYQLALGQLPPTSTTNSFLFAVLHSQGQWNVLNHSDGLLDALIEAQSVERDTSRRGDLVRDVQRYLLDQAYILSPVTGPVAQGATWVMAPEVRGFYPNVSLSEYFYWAKTWLDQ